ncbi:hypothetical protein [Desulfolucanica intricata]|uniref:hypothetical protein n=1 Tax=Desulfolucanica intricata TaxID=1285191 RepID=UPI0013520D6D|nr:hypothetical protein [Desulfolucanica intricata]
MIQASKELEWLELNMRSIRDLEDLAVREKFLSYLRHEADVLLLFPPMNEVRDELVPQIEEISKVVPLNGCNYRPASTELDKPEA